MCVGSYFLMKFLFLFYFTVRPIFFDITFRNVSSLIRKWQILIASWHFVLWLQSQNISFRFRIHETVSCCPLFSQKSFSRLCADGDERNLINAAFTPSCVVFLHLSFIIHNRRAFRWLLVAALIVFVWIPAAQFSLSIISTWMVSELCSLFGSIWW